MFTLNCHGKPFFVERPLVMGILNFTDDSFYGGSRLSDQSTVLQKAEDMIAAGADILDIGAQSTRSGSIRFTAADEIAKLKMVLPQIRKMTDKMISIDTYLSEVVAAAVDMGADIINDISGGTMDEKMIETVGKLNVPYICMHIKGTPADMQQRTQYEDILREITDYFISKVEACRAAGIKDVIIDPGLGFAKTAAQNVYLIKYLSTFKVLDCPILVGISRKSTIYKTLKIAPEEALNGTTVYNTLALLNGADILRVHDVKEAREALQLVALYQKSDVLI